MNIKEKYNQLISHNLTLEDFNEIIELKSQCKITMNQEYLYYCEILIIDIYINEGLLDDALNAALKTINNIDNVVFQKSYISLLDRIIYVFIHKRNFKSAYRYAFMKRNSLDLENVDEVNRWYLEMAYIYAELNQKDKALLQLKAILNNYPDDNMRSLTLSNLTKLYIDQKLIKEAKETLNECISLVYKLEDEEGIIYCEYLNTKLYILEKNYKQARRAFQDLFKNIHTISENYLGIVNEYISLLGEMDLYDEAYHISKNYLKEIDDTSNLYIKKDFYKNYLKIHILRNKNIRDDLKPLLKAIEIMETEVDRLDIDLLNETAEDDKNIEIAAALKSAILKIEKTINNVNISLIQDNLRDTLRNFSESLSSTVAFSEILYIMLSSGDYNIIPEFSDSYDQVKVFQYKKERLYEREFSYNRLEGTIVEMLISSKHDIIVDFAETPLPIRDIITGIPYSEHNVKMLLAMPINLEKEIIGCILFIAYDNVLNEQDAIVNLKIASKLLERKIIALHYQENIRARANILDFSQQQISAGHFYLDAKQDKMILSDGLSAFLGIPGKIISRSEYTNLVIGDDRPIYDSIKAFIEDGEMYQREYRLRINEENRLIQEVGKPYITKDGIIKFYTGVISLLALDSNLRIYSPSNISEVFERFILKGDDGNYQCSFVHFRLYNLYEYEYHLKDKIITYIYELLIQLSEYVYYIKNDGFIVVFEENDFSSLERAIKSTLELLEHGFAIGDDAVVLDAKAGVVRFPADTYNSSEILKLTNLCLEVEESYQVFNDEIRKRYLKQKAVNVCINEQLKRSKIELLYLPLEGYDEEVRYEVRYNINGLRPEEEVWHHLDNEALIMFEELAFKTFLKEIGNIDQGDFYFHITCDTLDYFLKNSSNINLKGNIIKRIILCLENFSPTFLKIISILQKKGFRISINDEVLRQITMDVLIDKKINGVFSNHNKKISKRLVICLDFLDIEYLNDKKYNDHQNIISRQKKYFTAKNIK